jgi:pimeloyl-ACP methyl ester carboxylesterase
MRMKPIIKTAKINGIDLEYTDYPLEKAPILVFLHGMGSTKESFNAMIPEFISNYRVLTIDQRGHGNSSKEGPFTFEQLVEDIRELLDHENLSKVSFVTGSFSGAIAQIFAAHYPERVHKLVLLDGGFYKLADAPGFDLEKALSFVDPGFESTEAIVEAIDKGFGELTSDIVRDAMLLQYKNREDGRYYRKTPDEASVSFIREYATIDMFQEIYPHVQCPVLFLKADGKDPAEMKVFFTQAMERYASAVTQVQTEVIPNSEHLMMLTNPQECAVKALSFLADDK